MEYLSDYEMLWTRRGRAHLRDWCERTPFVNDAKMYMRDLRRAEKKIPDEELDG